MDPKPRNPKPKVSKAEDSKDRPKIDRINSNDPLEYFRMINEYQISSLNKEIPASNSVYYGQVANTQSKNALAQLANYLPLYGERNPKRNFEDCDFDNLVKQQQEFTSTDNKGELIRGIKWGTMGGRASMRWAEEKK